MVQFNQRILELNPYTYWIQDEKQGAISYDWVTARSNGARNGAIVGATLAQPGSGDGRTSFLYDGVNDYTNIISSNAAFNGSEGTILQAFYHDPSTHNDAVLRRMFFILVDGNNFIIIAKTGLNSNLQLDYRAGGISEQGTWNIAVAQDDFYLLGISWSASSDTVDYYGNGISISAQDVGLGAWVGVPVTMVIGASSLVPANPYFGRLCNNVLFDYALSSDAHRYLYNAFRSH